MSIRPVIGIVGNAHAVPKFWGELAVNGAPTAYVGKVLEAGGRPVVLPGSVSGDLLDVVDGVILTGGGDIDPRRYGGSPEDGNDVDEQRDAEEIALVHRVLAAGIPLLGVCRGLQILAVAFGGTLRSDLGMSHICPEAGHRVDTAPESLSAELLGSRPVVTSLHRQAIADPGPNWRPTAWAGDGVIEAVEWVAGDWPVLGVQWHPELEAETGSALFSWLVRAASSRALVEAGGCTFPARRRPLLLS
jgi:putative glutamine amidotransferase